MVVTEGIHKEPEVVSDQNNVTHLGDHRAGFDIKALGLPSLSRYYISSEDEQSGIPKHKAISSLVDHSNQCLESRLL